MKHDQEQFELDIRAVKRAEGDLCISKNRDYGPFNIARAPGGPIAGLAVRLHDKIARLAHLLETGADPEHESVQDTFMDIANYGSIGQMVCRGLWPGVDEEKDRQPVEEGDVPLVAPRDELAETGLDRRNLPGGYAPGDRVRSYVRGYEGVGIIDHAAPVVDFDWTVEFDDGRSFAHFRADELEPA